MNLDITKLDLNGGVEVSCLVPGSVFMFDGSVFIFAGRRSRQGQPLRFTAIRVSTHSMRDFDGEDRVETLKATLTVGRM